MDRLQIEYLYAQIKLKFTNDTKNFGQLIQSTLLDAPDPYDFFLTCLEIDELIYDKPKDNVFGAFIYVFEDFHKKHLGKYNHCLSPLKLKAFNIAFKFKNDRLEKILAECFELSSSPDVLMPRIRSLLFNPINLNKIAKLIILLNFHSHFTVFEVAVPLWLQDHIILLEKFLDGNLKLSQDFLNLVEKFLAKKITITELTFATYATKDTEIKMDNLNAKFVLELGFRLLEKYDISCKPYPYLLEKQKMASLNNLFHYYYVDDAISVDAFMKFVLEIAHEISMEGKLEILKMFIDYSDKYAALIFVKVINLPEEFIPTSLTEFKNNKNSMYKKGKQWKLKHAQRFPKKIYTLCLPLDSVIIVDTLEGYSSAIQALKNIDLIALSLEWKPRFSSAENEEVAIFQVATTRFVYLFDIIHLDKILSKDHWSEILSIFNDSQKEKLIYPYANGKTILNNFFLKTGLSEIKFENFINLDEVKNKFLESILVYPSYFIGRKVKNVNGLSEMVYWCFGKPLNEKERRSHWKFRPLCDHQIMHAAIDAYCLIDIYDYLNRKKTKDSLPCWKSTLMNNSQEEIVASQSPFVSSNINHSQEVNGQMSTEHKNEKKIDMNVPNPIKEISPVNMSKENIEILPQNHESKPKFLLDVKWHQLGTRMRNVGLDTVLIDFDDNFPDRFVSYKKCGRILLVFKRHFKKLEASLPHGRVICLESVNPQNMLNKILKRFKIMIKPSDWFSRCSDCNGEVFLQIPKSLLKSDLKYLPIENYAKSAIPKLSSHVLDLTTKRTNEGVKMRLRELEAHCSDGIIYGCQVCGKCKCHGDFLKNLAKDVQYIAWEDDTDSSTNPSETTNCSLFSKTDPTPLSSPHHFLLANNISKQELQDINTTDVKENPTSSSTTTNIE